MTNKKTTPTEKSSGKARKKPTTATANRKAKPAVTSASSVGKRAAAGGGDSTIDHEPAHGRRASDASDMARDQRLRKDMEDDSGRSPSDRHRERLTAVEAEEDGVRDDDDTGDQATDQREAAIKEQDADDDRA